MIIAYIRCSTQKQQTSHQRHEIQEYADKNGLVIDRWMEETISSRKTIKKRKLGTLLEELQENDVLIATEISRLLSRKKVSTASERLLHLRLLITRTMVNRNCRTTL